MKNEIISAINEGKTVTVHEAPLSHSGWNGMGYTIIDPETGAGAYKISSGANGGILMILGLSLILTFGIFALVTGGVGALFALAFINAALAMFFQGLAMVLDSLGQERYAAIACGFMWITLGGVLGAVLAGFTALGAVGSILVGELFSGVTTVLSCL